MESNAPLQILIILKAVETFLLGIAPKNVSVVRAQSAIYIDGLDRGDIKELKMLAARFMKNMAPERTYKHSKVRGYKCWTLEGGDSRVGVRIVRTEEETSSMILGPMRGINC